MPVGFYFDMTRCTGCRACQIACKDKNRLDVGTIYRQAKTYSVGQYPEIMGYSVSQSCNHCGTPQCMSVCPTEAIYRTDDTTVIIDAEACIGCEACVEACPYSVPKMLPSGVAGKCDGCFVIRETGGTVNCVAACPNRALDFGDYMELQEKYGAGVNEIAVLPSASTTTPSLIIKAKDAATSNDYAEISW